MSDYIVKGPPDVTWVEGDVEISSANATITDSDFSWSNPVASDWDEVESEWGVLPENSSDEDPCGCVKPQKETRTPLTSWFLGSGTVFNYWHDHSNKRKVTAVKTLVQLFAVEVKQLFQKDGLPADIAALFELILKPDNKSNDSTGVQELPKSVDGPSKLEDVPNHGDQLVVQIQKSLAVSLELLREVSVMNDKIHSVIATNGVILRDTPEQKMCSSFMLQVVHLLKRLNVTVNMFRRDFHKIVKDEVVLNVLKMSPGSWVKQVEKSIDRDIYYSVVNKIEGLTSMASVAIVRVITSICYFASKELICDGHNNKLTSMATNLLVSANDGLGNFQFLTQNYAQPESSETKVKPKAISFSHGNKVKRQCDILINWSQQFEAHLKLQKSLAMNFIELEDDLHEKPQESNVIAKKLLTLQDQSSASIRHLQKLLGAQSVLLLDLRRKVASADANNPCAKIEVQVAKDASNDDTGADEESLPLESEATEFFNINLEDEQEPAAENDTKDELFVAYFRDEESSGYADEGSESVEENQAGALYSGVVNQLKDALKPVKTKMLAREKEATIKVFGELTGDAEIFKDELDSEIETVQRTQCPTPTPTSVAFEIKPDVEESCSADEGFGFGSDGNDQGGPNFLAELKGKLGVTFPAYHKMSVEEYELNLSGESDCDPDID